MSETAVMSIEERLGRLETRIAVGISLLLFGGICVTGVGGYFLNEKNQQLNSAIQNLSTLTTSVAVLASGVSNIDVRVMENQEEIENLDTRQRQLLLEVQNLTNQTESH